MSPKTLLRTLLIVEIVVGVTFLLIPEPYFETQIQAWELPFAAVLIIAALVSRVGLFFFWRPARTIFLATLVADVVATAFTIPEPHIGIRTSLIEVTIYLAGFILAMIYLSPIRDLYEKPKACT